MKNLITEQVERVCLETFPTNKNLFTACAAGCFTDKGSGKMFAKQVTLTGANAGVYAYKESVQNPGTVYFYKDNIDINTGLGGTKLKGNETTQEAAGQWPCSLLTNIMAATLSPTIKLAVDALKAATNSEIVPYQDVTGADTMSGKYKLMKLQDVPQVKDRSLDLTPDLAARQGDIFVWVLQQGEVQYQGNRANEIIKAMETNSWTKGRLPAEQAGIEINLQTSPIDTATKQPKYAGEFKSPFYMYKLYSDMSPSEVLTNMKTQVEKAKTDYSKNSCRKTINNYYDIMSKGGLNMSQQEINVFKPTVATCIANHKTSFGGNMTDKMNNIWNAKPVNGLTFEVKSSIQQKAQNESKENKLKNIIRENLVSLSNSKKKALLGEQNIITTRYSIIKESGKPKNRTQKKKLTDELISETFYLNSQGFNNKLINEEFLDVIKGLFGNAGEGVFNYIKERFATFIVTKLTPMDPNGWAANILITAVGNIPIGDYMTGKVFSCDYISDVLSKSVAEGALRKVQYEKAMGGPLYDILRNAIVETLEDTKFGSAIENAIGDLVCPLLGGIKEKMNLASDAIKDKALS
jgi:hypothetical protein